MLVSAISFSTPRYSSFKKISLTRKEEGKNLQSGLKFWAEDASGTAYMLSSLLYKPVEKVAEMYLVSALYHLMLNGKVPEETLIVDDSWTTWFSLFGHHNLMLASKYFRFSNKKLQFARDFEYWKKHTQGLEELVGAMVLLGETDAHLYNIGIVEIGGKNFFGKVDHDRFERGKNLKEGIHDLTKMSQEFSSGELAYRPYLDSALLANFFETISTTEPSTIRHLIADKLHEIEIANGANLSQSFKEQMESYYVQRLTTESKIFAEQIRQEQAIRNNDVKYLSSWLETIVQNHYCGASLNFKENGILVSDYVRTKGLQTHTAYQICVNKNWTLLIPPEQPAQATDDSVYVLLSKLFKKLITYLV